MNKKISLLLILLICLVACIENTEKKESNELNCQGTKTFFVSRVIDGDTIKTAEEKIRLIAVNAPEKKEACFEEAKEFLENEILGKEIEKCENKIWDICCKCYCFNWCGKKENNREYAGCSPVVIGVMALIISMFFIYFF